MNLRLRKQGHCRLPYLIIRPIVNLIQIWLTPLSVKCWIRHVCFKFFLSVDNRKPTWQKRISKFQFSIITDSGGSKGGGLEVEITLPLRKKSSPESGVSLWFGHILSEKQCPICLRLHDKTFGSQKFPRGRSPRPLYSKLFFFVKS